MSSSPSKQDAAPAGDTLPNTPVTVTDTAPANVIAEIRSAARAQAGADAQAVAALSALAFHLLLEAIATPGSSPEELRRLTRIDLPTWDRVAGLLIRTGAIEDGATQDGATQDWPAGVVPTAAARMNVPFLPGAEGSGPVPAIGPLALSALRTGAVAARRTGTGRPALQAGYQPGLIGRVIGLRAGCAPMTGPEECALARDLGAFSERLDAAAHGIWVTEQGGQVTGALALDGTGTPGSGRLRWFFVLPEARQGPTARLLIDAALAHGDAAGLAEIRITPHGAAGAHRALLGARGFAPVPEAGAGDATAGTTPPARPGELLRRAGGGGAEAPRPRA